MKSLPVHPRPPLMWSEKQVADLQFTPLKQAITGQSKAISSFAEIHLKSIRFGAIDPMFEVSNAFRQAIAVVSERAVEVDGQPPMLVPLVDLVGPPQWSATLEQELAPTCELRMEGDGDMAVMVLYAADNLRPGDVLSRDLGLDADQLMLRRGLAAPGSLDGDRADVTCCLVEGAAAPWQLRAIRAAVETRPGRLQGDFLFAGQVRRCDDVSEAVSATLWHTARVLMCKEEDDLEVYVGEVAERVSAKVGESRGLIGLFGDQRLACIGALLRLLKACRGEFSTTTEEDAKLLSELGDDSVAREAVGYRLQKKRVLEDVMSLLEIEKTAPQKTSGALPFAVMG